jgi:hypothetical protein
MNDINDSLFPELPALSGTGEDITAIHVTQNDIYDIKHKYKTHFIIAGIENDVKRLNANIDSFTIDCKSNEGGEKAITSLKSSNEYKPIAAKKSLEAFSRYNEKPKEGTFYQYIKQYLGTVQSIDEKSDIFTANLVNIDDEYDKLLAEFSFKDYDFGSDRELILIGANFVWLIGQEVEHGTVRNITKFLLRRTPIIRGKALQEAKDNARELSKLFDGIATAETTGDS